MSFTQSFTFGTPPANPCSLADLLAYINSIAAVISGTVGASDIAAGAVTSAKITPGQINWGQATFAANVYTINTPNGAGMEAGNGAWIFFRAPAGGTNTAGTVNANVNAVGNLAIACRGETTLPAGTIREYQSYCLIRSADLTPTARWDLISISSNPEDHYESVATTGTNDYVVTFAPALPALIDGLRIRFKVPNANTGAVQVNASGLGLKAVKKSYNQALTGGEFAGGAIVEMAYDLANGWWQLLSDIPATTAGAVVADGRNIIVKTSSAFAITVTADEVILKTSGGSSYVASSVNESVTTAGPQTGPGYVDTGTTAASTWYGVWLIYNPTTSDVAAMLSLSLTAPTMPAGYIYKALVAVAYNNVTPELTRFYQHDRLCYVESVAATKIISGATIAVTLTAVSLATAVPTITREAGGYIMTTSNHPVRVLIAPDTAFLCVAHIHIDADGSTGAAAAGYAAGSWRCPMYNNYQLYIQSANATPTYDMVVNWYRI